LTVSGTLPAYWNFAGSHARRRGFVPLADSFIPNSARFVPFRETQAQFFSLMLVNGEIHSMKTCQPSTERQPAGNNADAADKFNRVWGSFKGTWNQRFPGARFERKRLMRVEHRFPAPG
jgi:hypothetical protein